MSYFELICCCPNLAPGGGSPLSAPKLYVATDPDNDSGDYTPDGSSGYWTPDDTTGEGTEEKPFASFARCLQEAGRIIDRPTVIVIHNKKYAPTSPDTIYQANANTIFVDETTTGHDIDIIGAKATLYVKGDLGIGYDSNTQANAVGGTPQAVSILLSHDELNEGAIHFELADSDTGSGGDWGEDFHADDLHDPEFMWAEWEDDGLGGNIAGKYRAKLIGISKVSDVPPNSVYRYVCQNPPPNALPGGLALGNIVPGSFRLVTPSVYIQNEGATDMQSVVNLNPALKGRGGYESLVGIPEYVPPPVCFHGIKIRNISQPMGFIGVALRGGGYSHGMLILQASHHNVQDGILSADGLSAACSAVDDAVISGSCVMFDCLEDTSTISFNQAKGMIRFMGNNIEQIDVRYLRGTELEVANQSFWFGTKGNPPYVFTHFEQGCDVTLGGPVQLGRASFWMEGCHVVVDGFSEQGPTSGVAHCGDNASEVTSHRIVMDDGALVEIREGAILLDEPAFNAGVSGLLDLSRQNPWVATGAQPVFVGKTARMIIQVDTALHYGSENPGVNDWGVGMVLLLGKIEQYGNIILTNILGGGVDLGATDPIIDVIDGGELIQPVEQGAAPVIAAINNNVAVIDPLRVITGSMAKLALASIVGTFAASAGTTVLVGTSAAGQAMAAAGFLQEATGGVVAPYQDIRSLVELY